ncbi:MAG: hypothetical protein AB7O52_17040 [Planctomycetota bacterium]
MEAKKSWTLALVFCVLLVFLATFFAFFVFFATCLRVDPVRVRAEAEVLVDVFAALFAVLATFLPRRVFAVLATVHTSRRVLLTGQWAEPIGP